VSVDVWIIDLAGARPETDACTLDEVAHASGFGSPAAATRWLAAHGALRTVLSGVVGVPPATLRFATEAKGKPILVDHPDVHFSLSHARTVGAIAIADQPVGVDIEERRRLHAPERLARRLFDGEFDGDVLQQWTRTEALLKATGTGIAGGTRYAVTRLGALGWTVLDLDVPAAVAAVARQGRDWSAAVRYL
jgi:4'-phosphopantetheinyl transferase